MWRPDWCMAYRPWYSHQEKLPQLYINFYNHHLQTLQHMPSSTGTIAIYILMGVLLLKPNTSTTPHHHHHVLHQSSPPSWLHIIFKVIQHQLVMAGSGMSTTPKEVQSANSLWTTYCTTSQTRLNGRKQSRGQSWCSGKTNWRERQVQYQPVAT